MIRTIILFTNIIICISILSQIIYVNKERIYQEEQNKKLWEFINSLL